MPIVKQLIALSCFLVAIIAGSQLLTIFVVQPVGAVPEGRTIIITRLTTMNFVDSADAWCERNIGGVSLLCRGAVLARLGEQSTILLRLPYSSILYRISTKGRTYDR
jgi:hypothetical protein